jgi:5,10-methylenetetrahydrofolate reductase
MCCFNMEAKTKSRLESLLNKKTFVVTAELGPPKSVDPQVIDAKIDMLKSCVDAVNITDNQTGIVRMSSIGTGIYVKSKGLEPIIQVTCRDRNRLAIQADVLGAYFHGIDNILCLTGDHQKRGNHPGAKNVFDVDSIQLIKIMKDMRDRGIFECGEEIKNGKKADIRNPKFFIGGAENPFAEPLEWRVFRLDKKVRAGADFIQTQCIYDMNRFSQWMKEVVDRGLHEKVKILAGVTPVKSLGMLTYMKNSVAGVVVPDHIVQRIAGAKDAKEEGIKLCVEQIEQIKEIEGVAGVHIMAIEWEMAVKGIAEKAGLLPRPSNGDSVGTG